MVINHNLSAMNANRNMAMNQVNASKSMEKLSSGLRINKAGDDAAGLAISEKMRGQIRGLDQASANAQDGISLVQTAEGALNETTSILQRMREISNQSANGTNTDDDRKAIQDEITQLKSEMDRIGDTTEFNTQKLLNGNLKSAGATVGQNSTNSAVIAKQTAGTNASGAMATGTVTDADFVEETITIDGSDIKVNWGALSTDDKALLKTADAGDLSQVSKARDVIVNTINAAIDSSGKNVAHISGLTDSTGAITLKSGTEGVDSKIAVGTGVAGTLFTTATDGTSVYNGTTTANTADLKVNGVLMEIDLSSAAANGDDMATVATNLKTAINTSIAAYNATTGKTDGQEGFIKDVDVVATKDGRLSISSPSGSVELSDRATNSDVKDLGLSQAQTESAGSGGMTFQIGANRGQTITFGINDMRSQALGVSGIDASTKGGAAAALTNIDKAIATVSSERGKLGAIQNRLEHTIANLGTSSENLTSAESRIRDVDMAKEMTNFSKNNILSQAAQAMIGQAKSQPEGVLQLLR